MQKQQPLGIFCLLTAKAVLPVSLKPQPIPKPHNSPSQSQLLNVSAPSLAASRRLCRLDAAKRAYCIRHLHERVNRSDHAANDIVETDVMNQTCGDLPNIIYRINLLYLPIYLHLSTYLSTYFCIPTYLPTYQACIST